MEHDPIKNDARKEMRSRVLPQQACLACGISSVHMLVPTKVNRLNRKGQALVEQHHTVGKANYAKLTITLCRNHHAELTARNMDCGVSMKAPETILHAFIAIAQGLAAFLNFWVEALEAWADSASKLLKALDARCPVWRTLPEAKSNEK